MLVMHRNKYGSEYFTLVGGRVTDDETIEQGLVRQVKEETGMQVTGAQLVFVEEHAAPYDEQYIYLCAVASFDNVAIQDGSEEGRLNRLSMNVHQLSWVRLNAFAKLSFRTPHLQTAIMKALEEGFPDRPQKI